MVLRHPRHTLRASPRGRHCARGSCRVTSAGVPRDRLCARGGMYSAHALKAIGATRQTLRAMVYQGKLRGFSAFVLRRPRHTLRASPRGSLCARGNCRLISDRVTRDKLCARVRMYSSNALERKGTPRQTLRATYSGVVHLYSCTRCIRCVRALYWEQ